LNNVGYWCYNLSNVVFRGTCILWVRTMKCPISEFTKKKTGYGEREAFYTFFYHYNRKYKKSKLCNVAGG
jgi:hypothetical protein